MTHITLEELLNAHIDAFMWLQQFLNDMDLKKKTSTSHISSRELGSSCLMLVDIDAIETLINQISALIETLENEAVNDPNITIGLLLARMNFHPDTNIAMFLTNMQSSNSDRNAVDFLPRMIETRESLELALEGISGLYKINTKKISKNEAKEISNFINNIENLRGELEKKRKIAEQKILKIRSKGENEAEECKSEDNDQEDRKLTVEEYEQMNSGASNMSVLTIPTDREGIIGVESQISSEFS